MLTPYFKFLLLSAGWLSFALGIIGVFLPIMPTAPFMILAAYLFSKSSPRFHAWLLNLPIFGSVVRDWEESGVINPRAKVFATLGIIGVFSSTLFFVKVKLWIKGIVLATGIGVLIFVLTRPSYPRTKKNN